MKLAILLSASLLLSSTAYAEAKPKQASQPFFQYTIQPTLTTVDAAKALKWELGTIFAGINYLGFKTWDWGSNHSFKVVNEGWFGTDTGSAGADKLGHLYSSYLINEVLTKRLIEKTGNIHESAKHSALFSAGLMFWVELFDGYSVDHGFSKEDLFMNSAGIGISYMKNTVPGLDDKLDLRVEYHPTKTHSDHPIIDYSGYTYSSVLKLGGFERLKTTPLKYVELNLSYHTEGFKKDEENVYPEKKTELQVGIGLDLSNVLFKPAKKYTQHQAFDYADTFFRYYQMPGTYLSTVVDERKVPYH